MCVIKGASGLQIWQKNSNWSILRYIHFWKAEVMYFQKKRRKKKKIEKSTNWQPSFTYIMIPNHEYFEYFGL